MYILEIKKVYLKLILVESKVKKVYNNNIKDYDNDLTKVLIR